MRGISLWGSRRFLSSFGRSAVRSKSPRKAVGLCRTCISSLSFDALPFLAGSRVLRISDLMSHIPSCRRSALKTPTISDDANLNKARGACRLRISAVGGSGPKHRSSEQEVNPSERQCSSRYGSSGWITSGRPGGSAGPWRRCRRRRGNTGRRPRSPPPRRPGRSSPPPGGRPWPG